ncbi:hypothetical protein J7438_02915 [Thalassotalea sp. G20_0]|uniref:hypothetical protein n=1 Tax=Thalassotalea sp. G20_0 TaxID=2821093 RepID=UPI001ADB5C7F|nr:hypothetical protein [Thalassotalea sp. G20_0]MBO9493044.1 hypothetical protein [Thalassotalea sp. G20_0]
MLAGRLCFGREETRLAEPFFKVLEQKGKRTACLLHILANRERSFWQSVNAILEIG